MSITTKTGDEGKTSVMGKRVDKDSEVIEVIGVIDELMAVLGVVAKQLENEELENEEKIEEIYKINHNLYLIMGMISGYGKQSSDFNLQSSINEMEEKSKKIEEEKGTIREFLEAGKQLNVWLNWARTVCRRAERRLVKYSKIDQKLDKNILIYINRLSDYLFNLARII